LRLLKRFQALDEFLLLTCGETVADASPRPVEELSTHGTDASLYIPCEDLLGKLLEASLEPCKCYRRTPAPATLAALVGVASALLCAVWRMGIAVAG
jgi:hypothetical protein